MDSKSVTVFYYWNSRKGKTSERNAKFILRTASLHETEKQVTKKSKKIYGQEKPHIAELRSVPDSRTVLIDNEYGSNGAFLAH